MRTLLTLGLGALAMYLLDPEQGRRRRGLLREQWEQGRRRPGLRSSRTSRPKPRRARTTWGGDVHPGR